MKTVNPDEDSIQLLTALAKRLRGDPNYMAHVLAVYQEEEGFDDEHLSEALGTAPEMVVRLALCQRPVAEAANFAEQVRDLADYTLVDEALLGNLIRQADRQLEVRHHELLEDRTGLTLPLRTRTGLLDAVRHWATGLTYRPIQITAGIICLVALAIAGAIVWQAKRTAQPPGLARHDPALVNVPPDSSSQDRPRLAASPETSPASVASPTKPQEAPAQQTNKQVKQELIAQVWIKLGDYPTLRGVKEAGKSGGKAIRLPPSRTRLVLELPENSIKGTYRVSIVDADIKPLVTKTVQSPDGRILTVILNLSGLSEKASHLSVGRTGEAPHFYSVIIADSKSTLK